MVYRVYVEKKPPFAGEAAELLADIRTNLRISELKALRILNRYDVERIEEDLFEDCKRTVFSEPQTDVIYDALPDFAGALFAVEYLPGQFDQRADSCAQCIQIVSQKERPLVRTAKVYMLSGSLTEEQISKVKQYVINPVESREARLEKVTTLSAAYENPDPVETVDGFIKCTDQELDLLLKDYALAMDLDDLCLCRKYFREEGRDPTVTELRMLDTYWSDHCRHTTFMTVLDSVLLEDGPAAEAWERYLKLRRELNIQKPVCLMDMGTIAAKYLKRAGKLNALDESEEINACTVKMDVDVNGEVQDWLLLFKNETHNHPTEIEPFGGAATCIGGAIRDPLSGRGYVYQAMRVTGASDPTVPVSETIPGKLPQRKIVTAAAQGYSSYGNQIGLATGLVEELYHPGFAAKRMEVGAVLGAVPAASVRREVPAPGDVVILLGGRTGRDGCGGATGSSKSHTVHSLEKSGAEVQKGNAPEERKLQRLFRNPEATKRIKRCNDFGAGGVSVAIGELADGLQIDLNAVPKKYEGLDGTELAISESQERMAVVVSGEDAKWFIALAGEENLEATIVAKVTKEPRLSMFWNGDEIVNLSREFLNSAGAKKTAKARVAAPQAFEKERLEDVSDAFRKLVGDLNVCSKRGLSERFDSTIGAGTVLMPFGGVRQRTPIQAMAAKIPVLGGESKTCSLMAYGCNPFISEKSPYHGAYLSVVESVSKLIAAGGEIERCYLSFQEYFERLRKEPLRWGKPVAALLGALDAQLDLGVAAVGGKDSMSGSFERLDVPPTLISFAVSVTDANTVISPEFKRPGAKVILLKPESGQNGLPERESLLKIYGEVSRLIREKKAVSVSTPVYGGIAEAIFKMCLGNGLGFRFAEEFDMGRAFSYCYGGFLLELAGEEEVGELLGCTTDLPSIAYQGGKVSMPELEEIYEGRLERIFPCDRKEEKEKIPTLSYETQKRIFPKQKIAKPRVLIPVFPGTNCEYDSAEALRRAGAVPEIMVIKNLSAADITASVEAFAAGVQKAQMIVVPGGFSGGDEPDGAGKFITAFFRNSKIKDQVHRLLKERDGLMCGICNGFQALIKLGLVPYGEIRDADLVHPTLTNNRIGRHQSRLVRVRVASNASPWLMHSKVGDTHLVPISHGEGRFICSPELVKELADRGQIATQYVDMKGNASMDIDANPNGSAWAVEGITSPDGRVLGRMAHSERTGKDLYKNVPGKWDNTFFRGAVDYFQ
ncbi:MAG: phosphoribosylformylglycinamidine synthase [Oscillospiraceae bacterium]|nr:phosphoribosylformylglycinamidine synthase [Oscillospiraceae bacterium]